MESLEIYAKKDFKFFEDVKPLFAVTMATHQRTTPGGTWRQDNRNGKDHLGRESQGVLHPDHHAHRKHGRAVRGHLGAVQQVYEGEGEGAPRLQREVSCCKQLLLSFEANQIGHSTV